MFINYNKVVVFDTETTGLDFEKDQIIEIAALVMERINGALTATKKMDNFIKLHTLDKLPPNIIELTHITDDMLQEYGKDENEVAIKFRDIISNTEDKTLLVAHNAQFDLNMLYQMMKRNFDNAIDIVSSCDYLDTVTVYKDRKAYPHTLDNAIKYYKLEDKAINSHRAIDDVIALTHVTNALAKERDDLDEYINIFGVNPKYGLSGIPFEFIHYGKQYYNDQMVSPERIFPRQF